MIKINQYLKNNGIRKLHMGCGSKILKGWLNCDIESGPIYLDARSKLPFTDNTFDYIFFEHFIEHLTLEEGISFLKECFRIQKKGGIIRISTPNLYYIMLTYLDKNPYVKLKEALERHSSAKKNKVTKCQFFNDKMRDWGHQFIYDKDMLIEIITKAGYKDITEYKFGESHHRDLRNIEKHADTEWMKYAEPMIFEALKK